MTLYHKFHSSLATRQNMNVNEYIQSILNNENDSRINKQRPSNKNLKFENSYLRNSLSKLHLQNPVITEVDSTGLRVSSTLKKCSEESQKICKRKSAQKNSSESDSSYVTANSAAKSSYLTAVEEEKQFTALVDFENSNRSNSELQSEISFNSGIDKGKRELIIRLLQSKASDSVSEEESCTNCSFKNDEWDEDIDEQLIYKDKIVRFLQSIENQNLHDHSEEDFKKDSEDERRPVQTAQELSVEKNNREYFMNLSDKDFSVFERNESLEDIISRSNQTYLQRNPLSTL